MFDVTLLETAARIIKAKIADRDDEEARMIRQGYILICCAAAAVEAGLMDRATAREALKDTPEVTTLLNYGIRSLVAA